MSDIFDEVTESSGLTPEQEAKIIELWNKSQNPDLTEIGEGIFGPGFQIKSQLGKKLKKFIASRNTKKTQEPAKLVLTEKQQISVIQNATRLHDNLDLTQLIFPDRQITKESPEFAAVQDYVANIRNTLVKEAPAKEVLSYKAPQKPEEAIKKVNKATFSKLTKDLIDKESNIKTNLTALVRFLNSFRFGLIYDSYTTDIEKELFESSFVKYTFDKPDLTEEEVDQYINLCQDTVSSYNLKNELEYIKGLRDSVVEDSDGRKISMSLVESMSGIRAEIDANHKRQNASIASLQGKRANRIDVKIKENASVLQLVAAWKDKLRRNRMLDLADKIKSAEKQELIKLDSIESFKAELWGLSAESYNYTPDKESVVEVEENKNDTV